MPQEMVLEVPGSKVCSDADRMAKADKAGLGWEWCYPSNNSSACPYRGFFPSDGVYSDYDPFWYSKTLK